MYIAVNVKTFREYPQRALKFSIRKETAIDILLAVCKKPNYQDYIILYVE